METVTVVGKIPNAQEQAEANRATLVQADA
jgi:hypothetical protein